MNIKEYNQRRYQRKIRWYRIRLGLEQLFVYPLFNLIWLLFGIGIVFLVIAKRKLIAFLDIASIIEPIFTGSMKLFILIFPMICAIGIIQFIGVITAMKDEADMSIVFGDKRDINNQTPILIHKKTDRKTGVIKREFYTTIPMERWKEKEDSFCDRMDIHLVGDISYGGKNKNKGNQIYFESGEGRMPTERGVLYDDIF